MTNQTQLVKLEIDPSQYGLEKTEAEQIQSVFVPMLDKLKEFEDDYNKIVMQPITPALCVEAKALRLKLVKVRTGTDAIHKKAKAYYLAGGRAVDGLKNTMLFAIQGKEDELENIELHYVNIEKERKAKLQEERSASVIPYDVDPAHMDYGNMSDEVWANYFNGVKLAYDAKKKAEAEAEQARIAAEQAERERQAAIAAENERLKKEAEEKEAALKAEREAVAKEAARLQKEAEEKIKAEQEKAAEAQRLLDKERKEAEEKAERVRKEMEAKQAAEKAEADRIVAAERAEAFRIAEELRLKKEAEEAERKRIEQEKEDARIAAENLAKAGDKAILKAWIEGMSIGTVSGIKPASEPTAKLINEKFNAFKNWATAEVEKL